MVKSPAGDYDGLGTKRASVYDLLRAVVYGDVYEPLKLSPRKGNNEGLFVFTNKTSLFVCIFFAPEIITIIVILYHGKKSQYE